jgi:hypothetical protein
VTDFNRQDVDWFAIEGLVAKTIRGLVITPAGERKLASLNGKG